MSIVWNARRIWNNTVNHTCPLRWRVHGALAHLTLLSQHLRSKNAGAPNEVGLIADTSCIRSQKHGRHVAHLHAQKPHACRGHRQEGPSKAFKLCFCFCYKDPRAGEYSVWRHRKTGTCSAHATEGPMPSTDGAIGLRLGTWTLLKAPGLRSSRFDTKHVKRSCGATLPSRHTRTVSR